MIFFLIFFNENYCKVLYYEFVFLFTVYKHLQMNLHEYQGKEILNSFGVRIQRGIVASTP